MSKVVATEVGDGVVGLPLAMVDEGQAYREETRMKLHG